MFDFVVWLVVAAVMIVGEIMTLGLTSIWFAGGALIAAFSAWLGAGWIAQILIFAGTSIVLLIFTRPIAQKHMMTHNEKTNIDSLIGKEAIVKEDINNLKGTGIVKVNGVEWTARTVDEKEINAGEVAVIKRIEGVKVMVAKKEDE